MRADVVVAVHTSAAASVDAVYRSGGTSVGRVIAVCDACAGGEAFSALQDQHPELVVLRTPQRLEQVACWNHGLLLRGRDVLLVGEDIALAEGALGEMLEVLHASDRIASVVPNAIVGAGDIDLAGLPRSSDIPTARGPFVLLRHAVLHMIGAFDPAFERLDDAQDDWSMRAQRMGLRHVRANRASAVGADAPPGSDPAPTEALLLARHPHLPEQRAAALLGAEAHVVEHLLAGRGPLRVCGEAPVVREQCQVVYRSRPIDEVRDLLALLESPCHLVLGVSHPYRSPAILFAGAHAAQAIVTQSDAERTALIADLGLDAAKVAVVESAAALTAVFRGVVERPDGRSLRYRSLLANHLRSLPRPA